MSKDPTPRADQLRQQREERYGHLQAKADGIAEWTNPQPKPKPNPADIADKDERLAELRKAAEQKSRPYAGKVSKGEVSSGPRADAQKARAAANNARQRVKRKRRTELPPEKETL